VDRALHAGVHGLGTLRGFRRPVLSVGTRSSAIAPSPSQQLGVAGFSLVTAVPALAQNKCAGEKIKAACKKAVCKNSLEAKQASKGGTIDPAKVAKCEAAFSKSVVKSEAKGDCFTTGDAVAIEAKVDAFVADLETELDVGTGTNPNTCEGDKIKAAAKKASCTCALEAKQAAKGGTIDPAKVAKCEAAFSKSVAKSEAKGGCNTTGDAIAIEAKVDAFVADVETEIVPATSTTTSTAGSTTTSSSTSTTETTTSSTTSTTVNPCFEGGAPVGGVCWYKGIPGNSCFDVCTAVGVPYHLATRDFAGSNGTDANCTAVAQALTPGAPSAIANNITFGLGCVDDSGTTRRDTSATTASGNLGGFARYCACDFSEP
jgi:hypothetical protein